MPSNNEELKNLIIEILSITKFKTNDMRDFISSKYTTAKTVIAKEAGLYLLSRQFYNQMLNTSGLSENHYKALYKLFPVQSYILTNPVYNLCLIYIITFLAIGNDEEMAKQTAQLYSYITISYMKQKYFKILNADLMRYTLSMLHGHSLAREGFLNLADTVALETFEKYADNFRNDLDIYYYYRFLVDIRNKLNQSMKIIARKYYEFSQEKPEDNSDNASGLAEDIIQYNYKSNIFMNDRVLEYIAINCDLTVGEIEDLTNNILHDPEIKSLFIECLYEIIMIYKNIDIIKNSEDINDVYMKCFRNVNIKSKTNYICNKLGIDETSQVVYVKAIIYICVLMIKNYR